MVDVPATESVGLDQIDELAELTADTHCTICTVSMEQVAEIAARIAGRFRYISENNGSTTELLSVYSF